jgi:hypothetical protein
MFLVISPKASYKVTMIEDEQNKYSMESKQKERTLV